MYATTQSDNCAFWSDVLEVSGLSRATSIRHVLLYVTLPFLLAPTVLEQSTVMHGRACCLTHMHTTSMFRAVPAEANHDQT